MRGLRFLLGHTYIIIIHVQLAKGEHLPPYRLFFGIHAYIIIL